MSMGNQSCPQCGGTAFRLLSPGLRECTSSIVWHEEVVMTDPYAHTELGLTGAWRETREHRRTCGHEYRVQTPTSTEVSCTASGRCGAFAVGRCGDCDKPVCNHHSRYAYGRLLCDGCIYERERPAREAESARARVRENEDALRKDEYVRRARSDEAEHARLVPGFPYPPLGRRLHGGRSPYPAMTCADRLRWAARYEAHAPAPPLSEIVRALQELVPDRLVRAKVARTGGLFSRTTYAEGWPFITRTGVWSNREMTTMLSDHDTDLESRLLVTTEATIWDVTCYVPKGVPSRSVQDFDGARHDTSGEIDWPLTARLRRQVLDWLGHRLEAADEPPRVEGLECDEIRWGAVHRGPNPPAPSTSPTDPHRLPHGIDLSGSPLLWDGDSPLPVRDPSEA